MMTAAAETETVEIAVLLADDHKVVRQGLTALLQVEEGLRLVGDAASGAEAVRMTREYRPDVLVLDLAMPDMNGFDVCRRVMDEHPDTAVVVLSMYGSDAYVVEALKAGALGYVLKDSPASELVQAIRAAVSGERFLSPALNIPAIEAQLDDEQAKVSDPWFLLTDREHEVLQLAVRGLTSKQIGEKLDISVRTAEKHRANLMKKLGLRSPAQLVRYVMERSPQPRP